MARGAKTLSARPPPQAWLANCLDPTARVVTVSAKELGAMIEAREAKTSKSAPSRATAKSFRRATYSTEGVPAPPPGWRREVIPRKTVSGADAYYYSPCGKRMRSRPDVQRFLDKSKEQGKYLDVGIESFDFATGDRRGAPVKAPEAPERDATETDADGKASEEENPKPAKRAKKEAPAAKKEEPAAEGEPLPAKRGRGRPRRAEKAEGKGGDENAAETADE
jgi:hypothetical protein